MERQTGQVMMDMSKAAQIGNGKSVAQPQKEVIDPENPRGEVEVGVPSPSTARKEMERISSESAAQAVSHSCPRYVPRNMPFYQSRNRLQVTHNQGWKMFKLQIYDWFHVFLRVPTHISLPCLLLIWTGLIILFASLYVWVDHSDPEIACGLGPVGDPINFGPAFAFSLETCTTVGYGLPNGTNAFFDIGCRSLQAVIYFQMVWSMMFNAFLFAFFYSRLAKCDSRGNQVIFSKKAIVTMVDGLPRFQIRVHDVDARNPVIEAHLRIYVITRHRPVPRPLRLLQPDDDLGAMLFLSLPHVVSHQIDRYSMMHPPCQTPVSPAGLIPRQVDSVNCGREEVICPICGEGYGTYERWRKHVLFQRIVETKDEYPVEGTHLSLPNDSFLSEHEKTNPPEQQINDLRDFFAEELSEVICVMEGIEPVSSGTFAALQSYRFEDIVFHPRAHFQPCVEAIEPRRGHKGGCMRVDLDRFHGVERDNRRLSALSETRRQSGGSARSLRTHDSFFSVGPSHS